MKSNNLDGTTVKFFRTGEHQCSYLSRNKSRTLFLDPDLIYSTAFYEELTHSGFRRSGKHLYRPDCLNCHSCIPARIPVKDFTLRRKFKRVLKQNEEVAVSVDECRFRTEDYQLFERYINQRHQDGDMYPASESSYQDFLTTERDFSFQIRYSMGDKLIGVAVTDRIKTGLSAIYTFFDPDLERRSLGVYSILQQIQLCKDLNLPYLYLGYWIPGCRKMNYKTSYQPVELLIDGQWHLIEIDS